MLDLHLYVGPNDRNELTALSTLLHRASRLVESVNVNSYIFKDAWNQVRLEFNDEFSCDKALRELIENNEDVIASNNQGSSHYIVVRV